MVGIYCIFTPEFFNLERQKSNKFSALEIPIRTHILRFFVLELLWVQTQAKKKKSLLKITFLHLFDVFGNEEIKKICVNSLLGPVGRQRLIVIDRLKTREIESAYAYEYICICGVISRIQNDLPLFRQLSCLLAYRISSLKDSSPDSVST